MVRMQIFDSRKSWLKGRKGYIGGSDAAAIIGKNPYLSNVDLWRIKTGRLEPEDISDKPIVKYGHNAEASLRALFKLDYPKYKVYYRNNNMWHNDKYPFAHASLDGWLKDEDGRMGILEIKTTNILQSRQKEKWDHRIPDNYYCQVLWYMAVTEAEFAVLKAQLKYEYDNDIFLNVKHYFIERKDVEEDISYLMSRAMVFADCIKTDTEPALILNI